MRFSEKRGSMMKHKRHGSLRGTGSVRKNSFRTIPNRTKRR